MADHNVWEEGRKEAEDRARRNDMVERHDKYIEDNPDRAEALGLTKIGYDPMEHLKDSMSVSLYNTVHLSNADAKRMVDSIKQAREQREARERDALDSERRKREEREKWEREHPEEVAEMQRKERRHAYKLAVMRKVWPILGGALGGAIAIAIGYWLEGASRGAKWYFVGIPAMAIGIIGLIAEWREKGNMVGGCMGGCGGLVFGAVGAALFLWLHSAIPVASIGIGVVVGALLGRCAAVD